VNTRNLFLSSALCLMSACARPAAPPQPAPAAPSPAPTASAAPPEAFRAHRPAPSNPGDFQFPTPQVVPLDNGLRVYSVRRPTRVISVSLIVRHGASALPEGKSGLAALTARMLTEGTRRKPAARFAEAVENLGATLSAGATRDESTLSLTVLPSDLGHALALLAEVLVEPAFSPREFDRVRAEWLDGLRGERQNPQRLAMLAAVRALHGPAAGAPVNGSIADVQRLTIADLKDFHSRAYTPDNAALVIVGDVGANAVQQEVAKHFGAWRAKNAIVEPPPRTAATPERTRVLIVDRPGAVQSALAVVQGFPKRSDQGYEVREILGRVLGGLFTSRLNTNLREKHAYTYGASAVPVAGRYNGTLVVATSVRTDVTPAALTEIVRELERMRDPSRGAPLGAEELQRAKADLVFSLGAALEHPSRVADVVGSQFTDGLPADYHARYPALIEAVSPVAVTEAAAAITPEKLIVVIVGDRANIEAELQKRGFSVESAPTSLLD